MPASFSLRSRLAGYGLFGTLANEWARPVAVQEATYGMSIEAPVAAAADRSRATAARSRRQRSPRRHAPAMRPLHCQPSHHNGLSRRSRP